MSDCSSAVQCGWLGVGRRRRCTGAQGSSLLQAPSPLQQPLNLPALPLPLALPLALPALVNRRYLDNMTSERVDAEGMAHLAAAAAKYMPRAERSVQDVLSMRSAEDLAKWQR